MPTKLPFRVIHVSGQDEHFKAVELNTHSPLTKGWQSARFCLYPQDIVVKLDFRSRLRKVQLLSHQFLVATKVEFYVGDVPDGTPPTLQHARYTRLGYIELSSNEKTGFKARELKSVHVDAVGLFLKLVIHKNHVNKHNLYNQVGLVAINVIGDAVVNPSDPDDLPNLSDPRTGNDPALAGILNKPDYISPLDDLAFDMYQDKEIAVIIRKLEKKKQEAVLQERFDYAKRLKGAITELQKVGEKLGRYEIEKRQAVENEDYDKAKEKKLQMDEYRINIYRDMGIQQLLADNVPKEHAPPYVDLEPTRQASPPKLPELTHTPQPPPVADTYASPTPKLAYDERPLPALKAGGGNPGADEDVSPREVARTPYDNRALPAQSSKPSEPAYEDEPSPRTDQDDTAAPSSMSEKDQREASLPIDVFGLDLVSKLYMKAFVPKEEGFKELLSQVTSSSGDATQTLRAATYLVIRGLKDNVYGIFKAALKVLEYLMNDFVKDHSMSRSDINESMHKTLPVMLQRSGDTSVRIRNDAKEYILDCAMYSEIKPTHLVPHECVKPFKTNIAPRLSQSRTEIIESLYKQLGIDNNSGLSLDNMMHFLLRCLEHTDAGTRNIAERIIIQLYKDKKDVKKHLPPDDDKTRKNTLYRQLFEAFDTIDGKPSRSEMKKKKAEEEAKKKEEINALKNQLQQLKELQKQTEGAPESTPVADKSKQNNKPKAKNTPRGKQEKQDKGAIKKPEIEDDLSAIDIDNTCVFCGEKNEAFSDKGLDVHYWKVCPMLKRCANCKQVVEIAGLSDHYLSECEAKDNYGKCPRCSEAFPTAEVDAHIKAKSCPPSENGKNHCPLCHLNFPPGEESWKSHLMSKDGCKQNPRRLPALNNKGKPAAKGKKK
ncbi:unnamed protein product [Owenia fusiformis]|uniref:Centrosomal protein of 104 kDa n=1 Tax=Owenia fusiformis TaxID=6347 RepID=A0A8J1XR62_OWEFU|nr:unnamed protein product [Owenia fusiformis]